MAQKIAYLTIVVSDYDEAINFYTLSFCELFLFINI